MVQLDKHHIILYVVAVIFALGLTYTIESKVADRAEAKYQQAKAISDQKDTTNAQFQKQIADTLTQLQNQSDQLKAVNAQQQSTIVSLKQQLQDQKTKDSTLPPTDLAARIQTLAPGGSVTVVTNGYQLDQPEAVVVAQSLESVPVLQQQITADETVISNDTTIIANDAKALDAEKQSHTSDNVTAALDKATLTKEITVVKDEARKSKLKWFLVGVVTGFTLGRVHNLTF
jgi:hypothetical protein